MTTTPEPGRTLAQGSIVWAKVQAPDGSTKQRPLVIVTRTDQITDDRSFVAVAVTTSFPSTTTADYVELPWDSRRHPTTGLRKRSAAACRWLTELRRTDVLEIAGFVPTQTMLAIEKAIRRLHGEP